MVTICHGPIIMFNPMKTYIMCPIPQPNKIGKCPINSKKFNKINTIISPVRDRKNNKSKKRNRTQIDL